MNPDTSRRIEVIRRLLCFDPARIVAGDLRQGSQNPSSGIPKWDEFLAIVNGARVGAFDIWSNEELPDNQFYASTMTGGQNQWLVIGQFLYEPIALNRVTEAIVCFPKDGCSIALGDIDHFVADILFGRQYREFVPNVEQDSWWALIQDADRMTEQ